MGYWIVELSEGWTEAVALVLLRVFHTIALGEAKTTEHNKVKMDLVVRKPVFCGLQTTQAQTSLSRLISAF